MRQKASCVRLIIYSNEVIYINVQEVLVEMFQTRMNMRKVDVQCWQTSNNSNQSCELKKYMNMNCFKGRVTLFFILAQVLLGIIYDGKIVKMGRSDRKMVKEKKLIFLWLSWVSIFIGIWTSLHWHRYRNVTIQLLETGRSFVTGWYFPSVAADFSLIRFHELPLAWVQSYALLAGLPWWWGRRCCCCRRGWMVTDRQSWNEPLQVMYFWRILY